MKTKMISSVEHYFHALSNLDRETYLSCFSEDARVIDPYGGRPLEGVEGLNKFFSGMEKTWANFSMRPAEFFVSGDRVAVPWSAQGTTHSGAMANFAGIDVFTINDDGLISQMEGYWDAAAMMTQIKT